MSIYVGHIEPSAVETEGAEVRAAGFNMDDGRRVEFRASTEALSAYCAQDDDDAYLEVDDANVLKISGRPGRSLWSNAGLPWSID